MTFVKSVLAGIAAVIATIAIAAVAMAGYLLWQEHKFADSGVGAVVGPVMHLLPILCISVLIFAAGFWWQYRRAR